MYLLVSKFHKDHSLFINGMGSKALVEGVSILQFQMNFLIIFESGIMFFINFNIFPFHDVYMCLDGELNFFQKKI